MADMTPKILRGRLLSFFTAPKGPDDTDAYSYIEDGALLLRAARLLLAASLRTLLPPPMKERPSSIIGHI